MISAMSAEIGTMKVTRQIDRWRPMSPDQSVGILALINTGLEPGGSATRAA